MKQTPTSKNRQALHGMAMDAEEGRARSRRRGNGPQRSSNIPALAPSARISHERRRRGERERTIERPTQLPVAIHGPSLRSPLRDLLIGNPPNNRASQRFATDTCPR
eukprot:643096-Alexandrium_andersonii.AAC.1